LLVIDPQYLKPREKYQKWTSAPKMVASNYFPLPFALPLHDISNVHAVLPMPTTYLVPMTKQWKPTT